MCGYQLKQNRDLSPKDNSLAPQHVRRLHRMSDGSQQGNEGFNEEHSCGVIACGATTVTIYSRDCWPGVSGNHRCESKLSGFATLAL